MMKQQSHSDRIDVAFRRDACHFALEYLDRGYSVVPIRGKRPAVPWREYQHRRATVEEVQTWFGPSAGESFNVGIVTGAISRLVVVDTDDHAAAAFWSNTFPATLLTVASGGKRGGEHFYYQLPAECDVRNRAGVLAKRIDIRGEGGLIVAPPSLHVETKEAYRWSQPIDPFSLDDVPYFDPDWIAEPKNSIRHNPHAMDGTTLPSGEHVTDIRAYIAAIPSVSGNNGHNSCFRVACLLRDAGLTAEEALHEILVWNESNAEPPWSARELEHKINSAFGSQYSRE